MFKLIRQLQNVYDPYLFGQGILYDERINNNSTLVITDRDFNPVKHNLNGPFGIAGFAGNESIVMTRKKILALDTKGVIKKEYFYDGSWSERLFYDNDIMIIKKKVKDDKVMLCKYNFRQSQIIWEREDNDEHLVCRCGDYLIFSHYYKQDILSCLSEKTGALLWQVNVNELGLPSGTGYNFLGYPKIYKDYYFIGAKQDLRQIYLLSLDAATGKLLWHKNEGGFKFRVHNDKLLSFAGKGIHVIDPVTGALLQEIALFDKMAAADIDPYGNIVFKDREMYQAGILDTVISVWDIDNSELKWHYRLYEKGKSGRRGISIPASEAMLQVHGNRIYALDSENILHVFEKL